MYIICIQVIYFSLGHRYYWIPENKPGWWPAHVPFEQGKVVLYIKHNFKYIIIFYSSMQYNISCGKRVLSEYFVINIQ